MSAPQQGRQSPEPEAQSDAQKGSTVESGKIGDAQQKSEGKDDQTSGLESNPKHILEDVAADKLKKTEQ